MLKNLQESIYGIEIGIPAGLPWRDQLPLDGRLHFIGHYTALILHIPQPLGLATGFLPRRICTLVPARDRRYVDRGQQVEGVGTVIKERKEKCIS